MLRSIPAIVLAVFFASAAFALQQDAGPNIQKYVSLVESGQAVQVREEVPALLGKYPNNPGVLYIQGLVTTEGAEAVRIYQSIVDNFPKSEWADDALYKVYQFYYAIGLYRTAEMKLNQLKTQYPASRYLTQDEQVETKTLAEETESDATAEPEPDRPIATPPVSHGMFALQVGAYTLQVNAEKQKLFFEDLGYSVEVINKVKDKKSLFTVLVGGFATYEDAKAKGTEFKKTYNIESMVVSR